MLTSVQNVDGLRERGKFSITSRPLLNVFYHSQTRVFDKVIHRKPSATLQTIRVRNSFAMYNLRQTLCSMFLSIMKFTLHIKYDLTKNGTTVD